MASYPEGLVTFLLTDIEGSTRLWEEAPALMMEAVRQHDMAVDGAVQKHNGVSVKPRGEGDSRFIVFSSAVDAVAAAVDVQVALSDVDWATPRPIKVRASVHTGSVESYLGDYYGTTVNRAARLRSIGHGGQTLMSASTWELVKDALPREVAVEDLGEHSLKDLTRPERVYQVYLEGHRIDFPALASLNSIPNNLPRQLVDFVGREAELAEARQLLGETRLLTILGPGGAGKTRFAMQVAADVVGDYPSGVFFVSLADLSRPDDIVRSVAESIGLALATDEEEITQLLSYLSTKTLLLVLDNFEHLLDGASIVGDVLTGAPDVRVLATSRARLGVGGETALALRGLGSDWDSPAQARSTDGVRLFLEAAQRKQPGFELDEEDLGHVARILEFTGGMPLAILLAATWVDVLPVAEIADEIQRSLDFLESEAGEFVDRHRSVRAVFDYSWELLSSEEKANFAALSVFRGGFTRDAAARVAGTSLRALSGLVSKSLVVPSADKERYTIHELLRQFAQAELESDPVRWRDVRGAHAAFFADTLDAAFGMLAESDEPGLVRLIEMDLENTRTAWRHLAAEGDARGLRKMLPSLYVVYEIRSWYRAGLAMVEEALEALGGDSSLPDGDTARNLAIGVRAWFLTLLGQPDLESLTEANASLRESGDLVALWIGLQSEALNCAYAGLTDRMVEAAEEVISVGSRMGDPFYSLTGHNWRSRAALYMGDLDTGRRLLPEALQLFEKRGEYYFMVWNLGLQAGIATLEGRLEDALELTSRQAARAEQVGYRRGLAVALHSLGRGKFGVGDVEGAEQAFRAAVEACDSVGLVVDMVALIAWVARTRGLLGRRTEAVELLSMVLAAQPSSHQGIMENLPVSQLAKDWLGELEPAMDPSDFSNAMKRGAGISYEEAARSLVRDRPAAASRAGA